MVVVCSIIQWCAGNVYRPSSCPTQQGWLQFVYGQHDTILHLPVLYIVLLLYAFAADLFACCILVTRPFYSVFDVQHRCIM